MAAQEAGWIKRAVSPLELDLVFVLAIGQLTHHLLAHLTWQGAAETLIMLVAVCGVWAFTTFEVTLLDIERFATRAVTIAVMGLGLFMNAGIAHAFDDGPWLFVVPLLIALGAAAAHWLPSMVAVALLVVVLLALAVHLSRERETGNAGVASVSES